MNREKCFPNSEQLKRLNALRIIEDDGWQKEFQKKWIQINHIDADELELNFTRLCQNPSISKQLYYLNLQIAEHPDEVISIIKELHTDLSNTSEAFEIKLKQSYFGFWYLDFKSYACQILNLNDEAAQNFSHDIDRHFGHQSTIASKQMHLDALFEYYAYLKELAPRKPSVDMKSILLTAFVDQATRCSAGLLVLLYQQISSINEPINLEQFIVQYSSSLINEVSLSFKEEVDVHQKNFIFSYARKLGYPSMEEIDDPHVIPAFDDFQAIITQIHSIFYQKYHFFGFLNYILEKILEKMVLNWEYNGLISQPNEKYNFSKVSEMYEFIQKYTNLEQDISSESIKSIFVTQALNQMVFDDDLFIVRGLENHKLVLAIVGGLVSEGIFLDHHHWHRQLHIYFTEGQEIEEFPVFENVFHLAYFIKLLPTFRYQDEIILILRYFQSIPEHQWLDDILFLLKILGNDKNHLPVIETLHQNYPFTQDLTLPTDFFKNRLQQIYQQKYLFGPVVQCLNFMKADVFQLLLMEINDKGFNFLAQLIQDDSTFLGAFLEKIALLEDIPKQQIITQPNPLNHNLLCISIDKNQQLVCKLLTWVTSFQPDALLPLLTGVNNQGLNPLAYAIINKKQIAIESILEALDDYLDPDMANWYGFFRSFNCIGNHILQTVLLDAPECLPKIINLLSRFDLDFQKDILSHRNQAGSNSIMLMIEALSQHAEFLEQFLNHLVSEPKLIDIQWFTSMSPSIENLLIQASKHTQEVFFLIRKLFLNLSSFDRFRVLYQMSVQDLVVHSKLHDLFADLNAEDFIRICRKVDKTTGRNLLLQLASQNAIRLKQILSQHSYLSPLLFDSVDIEKQNVFMICLNPLNEDKELFDFLFHIFQTLEVKKQVEVLCHQDKNALTLFSLSSSLDTDRIGFNHYEKTIFLHCLSLLNKDPELRIDILFLILKNYFTSLERFIRFIKISDYFFNYCAHLQDQLRQIINFIQMTQIETHSFSYDSLELLGHGSKAFQKFYKQILVNVLDVKFEKMKMQQVWMSKLLYLRFSLTEFGEISNCNKWLQYLLECPPEQSYELINTLIEKDLNILIFALQHFHQLGVQLTQHIRSQSGFDLLCFKPNSKGECLYTSLLKAGCLDIILNKRLILLSCDFNLPILANLMHSNGNLASVFKRYFASGDLSIQEKIEFLGFNFYFYSNYQKHSINQYVLEFFLQELLNLPVLSQKDFNCLFKQDENTINSVGFYHLLELSLNSSIENLQIFFGFLEKQQKIDILSMKFGLNTVMHALRGIEQTNYQFAMDILKTRLNYPVFLMDICTSSDLIINTFKKAMSVDCSRLMRELFLTLPSHHIWQFFIQPDATKRCALNYLSLREDLQQEFFDFFKTQGLDFDNDLYMVLLGYSEFDKTKGGAILKMCRFLSLDNQIKLFSQWHFFDKYKSRYLDFNIIPALLEQVFSFDKPVVDLLISDFSWKPLLDSSLVNLKNINFMLRWLGFQSIETRYQLLKQGAILESLKSTCSLTVLDNMLCVVRTLPKELQKELLESLNSLQDMSLIESEKLEKIVSFKIELDMVLAPSNLFAFFEQPKDSTSPKGPAPL